MPLSVMDRTEHWKHRERESVRKRENTKIDFQIPTQIFSIFKTVRSFNFKPRVINILQTI